MYKKKKGKAAIVSLLITALLFTAACGKTLPEKVPDLRDDTADYVGKVIAETPEAGKNDLAVFNLLKTGSAPEENYGSKYLKSAETFAEGLKAQKNYDYETLAFAAMAVKEAGGDPRNIKGVNLMDYLGDLRKVKKAGPEAECYAVIGMKYCNEERKALYKYDENILKLMEPESQWKGMENEAELRGLSLLAMSYYRTLPEVTVGIDGTLSRLRELQNEEGGFGSCTADAVVASGLAALSIDPHEFKKNEDSGDLLTSLLSYREKDGFRNTPDGDIDEEATVKAFTVLNQYKYKVEDQKNFFVPENSEAAQ